MALKATKSRSRRAATRSTRWILTATSKLSSGTGSCGGEGARFLRGGEGGSFSKKDKMVPFVFFFFFFFFWAKGLVAFVGATSTGISSSVAGGVDRTESESDMFAVVVVVEVERRCGGASVRVKPPTSTARMR
jgi:hypothetical protein